MRTTRDMSDRHEAFLAEVLNGRKTKGSGSHWSDQTDGKQANGSGEFVFAWDGKSTLNKSISITLEMWGKLKRQASWSLPLLPLRFYLTTNGTRFLDLVVLRLRDFVDLQNTANEAAELRAENIRLRAKMEGPDVAD